jgi:hypothetical protein
MSLLLGRSADAPACDSLDRVTACGETGVSCFGDGEARRAVPRLSAQGHTVA